MKKIVLLIFALVLIASGVAAVSAYEAHLINVEAHVENALSVTPSHIDFGNVFPEEWLSENLTVQTSQSFRDENQDRVTSVNYSVWVEWKACPDMDYAYLDNGQWVPGTGFYNWLGYFTYIAIDPVIMTAEAIGGDLILVGEPPPGTPGTAAKWVVDAPASLHKVSPDANEEDEIMVFIDVPVFEGYYNSLTDPEPKPSGFNDPTWIIPDGSMDYTDLPRHPLYDPDGMEFGLDIKIQVIDVGTTTVDVSHPPVAVPDTVTTSKDNPVSGNVLAANPTTPDSDADGDPLTVTEVNGNAANVGSWFTLPSGAQLLVNADGSFTYDPNGQFASLGTGETDSDTFNYTITDGNGNFDSTTVTVTITGGMIWYVDNSVIGPGTGTLADPFNTLFAAETASGSGDIIYIFEGDGVTTGQDAGITLKNNQQLIGEGVALVVSSVTILPAGNPPTIANTAGNAVTLASGNTIRGLNISDTPSGHGIQGNTVGTVTVNNVLISGAGGLVDIDTGTISMAFGNLVSTSSTNAIKLHNISGTFNVADPSISGASVSGIDIMNAGPGATFTFGDTIISGVAGINLDTNNAASFTFSGLSVSTTNGAGLVANNSGTVTSTSQPTINATGGPAININNTVGNVGGGSQWSFAGVTSLNSTGDGIAFENVSQNINLTNIDIDNPFGEGIKLTNVTGASNVINEGSIDGYSTDGHGISLQGVTGTTTVQGANAGSKFEITNIGTDAGSGHSGINVISSGDLTVQYVDFDDIGQSGNEHGVNIENPIAGGTRHISITDSYFANIGDVSLVGAGSAVDLEVTQAAFYTGTLDVVIQRNDINGNDVDFNTTNQGVNLDFTAGSGGNLEASVNNNDIDGVREAIAVIIQGDAGKGGNRNVLSITHNTVDDVDSNGIELDVTDDLSGSGNSTTRALITDNTLTAINYYTGGGYDPDTAIEVEARGASAPILSVDINNNVITGKSDAEGERWDGNGITVGSAGSGAFAGTLSFDVEDNLIDFVEDDGILVKADEGATVNTRLMGNTLGANVGTTAVNGIEIAFEADPATMNLYLNGNEVGTGNIYNIETLATPTLNFECDPSCPVGLGSTSGIANLVSILDHNGNTEAGGTIVAADVANPGAAPYIVVASGTTPPAD